MANAEEEQWAELRGREPASRLLGVGGTGVQRGPVQGPWNPGRGYPREVAGEDMGTCSHLFRFRQGLWAGEGAGTGAEEEK